MEQFIIYCIHKNMIITNPPLHIVGIENTPIDTTDEDIGIQKEVKIEEKLDK